MWRGGGGTVGRVGEIEMRGEIKPPPSAGTRTIPTGSGHRADQLVQNTN